ncbi:hypothetical protein FRC17_005840 [Serendipita sp. 399]|nr:hypothetical protein FRC17_005840 [Serendipita sp. 399]
MKEDKGPVIGMKRKEPPPLDSSQPTKRRKLEGPAKETPTASRAEEITKKDEVNKPLSTPPAILDHVVFGLTQVGKALERHIAGIRNAIAKETTLSGDISYPVAVMACRWDVNPPQLFSHIPHLVASSNTLATLYQQKFSEAYVIPEIKLINLPKGAEASVSESIGLRRVSILLLTIDFPKSKFPASDRMQELLRMVPRIATPWLIPTTNPTVLAPVFQPTHVKHLKTTAPADMKAARSERTEARKQARERRRRREKPKNISRDSNSISAVMKE